ncbi:hemolysin family protein [Niabella drilacis]|uniref:Putative hemolysin n=1 Tax=Niabella drilacis (strain DSM 25811 / CCM 8410 / CCUG 62505 / LMG 26954 / E90) TaxID=1285928 RepID=A0A1G6Z402_NIADE|nr:hemolysin family protein [Niabella drilacis]SDD97494.1 putative hemolysin [Niabella drilacis]
MELFIIALLILLNGLFSMAEIALVSARKARLEAQANKGDKRAEAALKLANHPDVFLSTVQIGITLIGILTGIYSGEKITGRIISFLEQFPAIAAYSKGIATTTVVIIITYFTLIFGELVPKRIGLSSPEKIAKFVAQPMRWVSIITYPFIWLLTKSSGLIGKILNIKSENTQVTEEEIKAIISEGTEQGTLEETEQEIIERVFHLSDRNITSLMTHRSDIVWFKVNDTEEMIREKILKEPHSIYPICDEEIDDIKGVISLKDLYTNKDTVPFKELMRPALFVPENNTAFRVMEKFKESQLHSCFIVDEYGSVLGMITLNDILEAIIGDMPEENEDDYEITRRDDDSFLVDAQIPFYDFLSYFDKAEWMNEGEQEFDTLAGFILHRLKQIPATGDKLDWNGFDFEIVDMDGHRIDKVLVHISETLKEEMDED